jgi:photosystem II stability/assembly factor-like uncharacterized protein
MSNETNLTEEKSQPVLVPAQNQGWEWIRHELGSDYRASASNGKILVVVGDQGIIRTTSDGTTWLKRQPGHTKNLYGICYSEPLNLFVAVGYRGLIVTSPDGITWTERLPYTDLGLSYKAVAYGNGMFIAVGVQGIIKTSADGKTWKDPKLRISIEFDSIHFAEGMFVAPGVVNHILTTTDGETWKIILTEGEDDNLYSVTYGNKLWVVGGAHGVCYTSPDGNKWTKRQTGTTNYLMDIVYTGNEFVAVGDSNNNGAMGSMLLTSPDGVTWKREKAPTDLNPNGAPCISTMLTCERFGDRVYVMGARGDIFAKKIKETGPTSRKKTIYPGVNTISGAFRVKQNWDELELMPGKYEETQPIYIPEPVIIQVTKSI